MNILAKKFYGGNKFLIIIIIIISRRSAKEKKLEPITEICHIDSYTLGSFGFLFSYIVHIFKNFTHLNASKPITFNVLQKSLVVKESHTIGFFFLYRSACAKFKATIKSLKIICWSSVAKTFAVKMRSFSQVQLQGGKKCGGNQK